jgi:hypothetical protein
MQIQLPTIRRSRVDTPGAKTPGVVADTMRRIVDQARSLAPTMPDVGIPDAARDSLGDFSRAVSPATRAAGPALEALPGSLEALADALRGLPATLEGLPGSIEALQRRRRPRFWQRQGTLFALLGVTIVGGLFAGWWMVTSTRIGERFRMTGRGVLPFRRHDAEAGTATTTGETDTYAPTRRDLAEARNGRPRSGAASFEHSSDTIHDPQKMTPSAGAEDAARATGPEGGLNPDDDPSWTSVGPGHPELQAEVAERSIRG